jgi:hypothetical protein
MRLVSICFPFQARSLPLNQAAVGGDAGTLEIDLDAGVEGELKGLTLYLTHLVLTSGESSSRSHPHEY